MKKMRGFAFVLWGTCISIETEIECWMHVHPLPSIPTTRLSRSINFLPSNGSSRSAAIRRDLSHHLSTQSNYKPQNNRITNAAIGREDARDPPLARYGTQRSSSFTSPIETRADQRKYFDWLLEGRLYQGSKDRKDSPTGK